MAKKQLQQAFVELEDLAPPADEPAAPELEPVHEPPKITDANLDNWIDDLAGGFTDPIIVYPGGWGETLPEGIKGDIQTDRLIQMMLRLKGDPEGELATWPEVCAYMYTVTLEFPVDHDWTEIYMYAMTQYKREAMPEDIRKDSLTKDQVRQLTDFRSWLYNARKKARIQRRRGEKRVEREERKAAQAEASAEPSPQMPMDMLIPDEYEGITLGGR